MESRQFLCWLFPSATFFTSALWAATAASEVGVKCRARVAHCLVGTTRTLPQPEVYGSIARHLVFTAAPPECTRLFFVLDLTSAHDSPKGGVFAYSIDDLHESVWRVLPPARYVLNPPLPTPGTHSSYRDPGCIYQCLPMFDKARRCLDLVRAYEAETGQHFDWIVRSRPDLEWSRGPGSLSKLSPRFAYAWFTVPNISAPADMLLIAPRHLVGALTEGLMEKCHLPAEAVGCHSWSCQCWIKRFAEAEGITIRALPLEFEIRRLPTAMERVQDLAYHPDHDSASDQKYTWSVHKSWNRILRDKIVEGPLLGEELLGHVSEPRSSTAELPLGNSTCATFIEQRLCSQHRGQLTSVNFYLDAPIKHSWPAVRFGVWRPVRGNDSRFFLRWSTRTLKRYWLGPQSSIPGRKLLLRQGDCLGWSACGSCPIPFDDPPADEPPGTALQHRSQVLPQASMAHGPFTTAPARQYSLSGSFSHTYKS